MSYCVNCGVELAKSEKVCPLCKTPVINPNEPPDDKAETMFPGYRMHTKQKVTRSSIISLLTLIFLIPDFLSVISDISINGKVTWSGFVLFAVLFVYIATVSPILFEHKIYICFSIIFVDLLIFLWFIEYQTKGDWFLSFAAPVVFTLYIFVMLVELLARKTKISDLGIIAISAAAFGVFSVSVEIFLNITFNLRNYLAWSFYPLVTFAVFAVILVFIDHNKPLKEKLRRKFFI